MEELLGVGLLVEVEPSAAVIAAVAELARIEGAADSFERRSGGGGGGILVRRRHSHLRGEQTWKKGNPKVITGVVGGEAPRFGGHELNNNG